MSKIIERLLMTCLRTHLLASANFCEYQSAYRKDHSMETALLEVLDGLYTAADNKQVTILISLDFSAVFDIVDHKILLEYLQTEFGVTGMPQAQACRSSLISTARPSTSRWVSMSHLSSDSKSVYFRGQYWGLYCSSSTAVQWLTSSPITAVSTTSTLTIRCSTLSCTPTTQPPDCLSSPRVLLMSDSSTCRMDCSSIGTNQKHCWSARPINCELWPQSCQPCP